MALATRKNGVPLLNKSKASGVDITSLGQKFLNVDFEFMQFEISTTQAGTTDLHSNWYGGNNFPCADISWGDGSFETISCGTGGGNNVLHSYVSDGNYSIRYYSINTSLLNAFKNVSGQTAVSEFITDITSWGWTIGDPRFNNRFGSDYVSVISATDLPGRVTSIGASGTAITFIGIANFPDDLWQPAGFGNSTLYNEDFSSVRPATLGTSMYAKFRLALAFNRDLGRWSENNMTRAVNNFGRMFELTEAFNNGGVGGVGVGLDTWNINQTYAKGTNTSVTTNKLIDSSATFISDDVVAGMEVYIVYQREFTTIASVDSETELTLNADLFTTSPQNYLIKKAGTQPINTMFYQNKYFNQYIGSWDLTGITSLSTFMFQRNGFGDFNQDISSWDIVNVTNMQQAFRGNAMNFGNPIGQANTSAQAWNDRVWQVTSWVSTFGGTGFNSDTSGWSFGKLGNSSTNTTQTDFKLIDSTATFITDGVNTVERVTNMDTGKQSTIASVDSETQLTLTTNIFVDAGAGENYEIFRPTTLSGSGIIQVEYDVGVWDTRCVTNFGNITSYDSNRTQWDLSGWNTRNVNTLSQLFASSSGSSEWDFEFRNWERGAIGDADYSTIKCVTSFNNLFYHSDPQQNKGCENWDTRNVTNMSTMNQNGRFKQSVGEWDIRSLTNANAANIGGVGGITRIKAQVYLQWPFQTPGPLEGVSASTLMNNGVFSLTATESTVTSGTTTGVGTTTTDKVIDSSATFVTNGVAVGDTVNNTTTGKHAYVTSVDSETQLSVTQEYFGTSGDAYSVVTGYDGQEAYHGYRRLVAPTPATNRTTGTTTSTTTNKLVDSSATFLTNVGAGDLVKNTTDGTYSYVDSVDSDTELTLGNDIFVSGESYSVDGGFGWVISGTSFS